MNDRLSESISALMDDAGDDLELRRLLSAMETDPALVRKWHRYHLVSAILRREHVAFVGDGVPGAADRARAMTDAAAAGADAARVAASPALRALRRHGPRAAVAALAAAGVIFVLGEGVGNSPPTLAVATPGPAATAPAGPAAALVQPAATTTAAVAATAIAVAGGPGARPAVALQAEDRARRHMLRHVRATLPQGQPLPFAKVVAFEP
jgi:sigma-E factor negative regulatory protein RseA